MRARDIDELRLQILLLKKNAPTRALALQNAIAKLAARFGAANIVRRLFMPADGLRSEISHLTDMARESALLLARTANVERRLQSMSALPGWMSNECRRELAHRIQGWLKECGSFVSEATRAADLLHDNEKLAVICDQVQVLAECIDALNAAYDAAAGMDGPASGEHRTRLALLQTRLPFEDPNVWIADVAAAKAAIEADGRNSKDALPLAVAVRDLDAGLAEALKWRSVLGPAIADPTPLHERRTTLDPGRNADIRGIYDLLCSTNTHLRDADTAAQRLQTKLDLELRRRCVVLAGIEGIPPVPGKPASPITAADFEAWQLQARRVLQELDSAGVANLPQVRTCIDNTRTAILARCVHILGQAAPETALVDSRRLSEELQLEISVNSFGEALERSDALNRRLGIVADLEKRMTCAHAEWEKHRAEADALFRSFEAARAAASGPSTITSAARPADLISALPIEPQIDAVKKYCSGMHDRVSAIRTAIEHEIGEIRHFVQEVCRILSDNNGLGLPVLPPFDAEIANWIAALRRHQRVQDDAKARLKKAEAALAGDAREEAETVCAMLPELEPGMVELGRRLYEEAQQAELAGQPLERYRRREQLLARLRQLREQVQADRQGLDAWRSRVGAQFANFFERRLNDRSPRFLCDRAAGLLQPLQDIQRTPEQERFQLVQAEMLLRALEAHALQAPAGPSEY
jgi:hypothetical protein